MMTDDEILERAEEIRERRAREALAEALDIDVSALDADEDE